MSNTQERIKKRREYLKQKRGAYIRMSVAAFLSASAIALILLTGVIIVLLIRSGMKPSGVGFFIYVGAFFSICFGLIARYLMRSARQAHQDLIQLPYVPPVTADTLPAGEVLVRGSEEPTQEQSHVLLRGTDASTGTGEQELLRGN